MSVLDEFNVLPAQTNDLGSFVHTEHAHPTNRSKLAKARQGFGGVTLRGSSFSLPVLQHLHLIGSSVTGRIDRSRKGLIPLTLSRYGPVNETNVPWQPEGYRGPDVGGA